MPLALLLQNATWSLAVTAAALVPWVEIVAAESMVIERARSAFLVHWFGRGLPFDGLSLRVAIGNLGELAARYRAVLRLGSARGGPDLTAPLAGFAGMLAGVLLSPVGAVAGARILRRFAAGSVLAMLAGLAWVAFPWVLAIGLGRSPGTVGAIGAGLLAAGLGAGLVAGLGEGSRLRAGLAVLAALGRLADATASLLAVLRGPRDGAANPAMRALLHLADMMAALFAQTLGVAAVLTTRIGPVLRPAAALAGALGGLVVATLGALGEIVGGLTDAVARWGSGPLSIGAVVGRVADVAGAQLRRVTEVIRAQFALIRGALAAAQRTLSTHLDRYQTAALDFVPALFTRHPTTRVMLAFREQLDIIAKAWPVSTKPPSAFMTRLRRALPPLPPIPDFPELPTLPDRAALRQSLGAATVPDISPGFIVDAADRMVFEGRTEPPLQVDEATRAAATRLGERPSILAPERRAAEAMAGGPLPAALELNRQRLAPFRAYFGVVLGRILPPAGRPDAVLGLAEKTASLDTTLYGQPDRKVDEDRLPVLDIRTDDRLRPVVHRLRLRVPGANPDEARRFAALVSAKLTARSYPAAAGS